MLAVPKTWDILNELHILQGDTVSKLNIDRVIEQGSKKTIAIGMKTGEEMI